MGRKYKSYGRCAAISPHLIVKTGTWIHLTKAATMKFIADNTSIPVPKVYCAFVRKKVAYIVMERIKDESLNQALNRMSEDEIEGVFLQLKVMIQELRALKPPEGMLGVQSCVGGSLRDHRIPHCRPRFGPFKTIQEFHRWLKQDVNPDEHPERKDDQDWRDIKDMVARQEGPWPPSVFTHGDLITKQCRISMEGYNEPRTPARLLKSP
jgi:aminoglycoside phosphotransferase (APT) family kinase protein